MMKTKTIRLLRLVTPFLLFSYTPGHAQSLNGVWSGTMHMEQKYEGQTGNNEKKVIITITDNRASGTVQENGELIIGGKQMCKSSCSGSGVAELHEVIINKEEATYRIHAISPPYTCTNTGTYCETPTTDMHELDLIASDIRLDNNPNVLVGSKTEVADVSGMGTVTTTVTWNLVRSIDALLIVTPREYDIWLPVPGRDEITPGKVMNVDLKVQRRNGQPSTLKAKAFELTLSNTSKELGITLNAPLIPQFTLPDLRFLVQPNSVIANEFQFIRITCDNCVSGTARIGAYDGGGWTTLTAVAILEDDSQIKGSLLVPTGEQEILIPKRAMGSKIATKWLNENQNPGEMDDKETTPGNSNNGDGLTAYEEYRGVISKGVHKRLDPQKKELGVFLKKTEFSLFSPGFSWLDNATGIIVVPFHENEIETVSRRLNKNASTAHVYKQYVQILQKGSTSDDAIGENQPIDVTDKLPVNVVRVVINVDKIKQSYLRQAADLARTNRRDGTNIRMPYTAAEEIANTVAHELAHGIGVNHHGFPSNKPNLVIPPADQTVDEYHVYGADNIEIIDRPWPINGLIGIRGNDESGDLSCIMAYTSLYQWAFRVIGSSLNYYAVPLLPQGKSICKSKSGERDINTNDKYFGEATFGDCRSKLKLRD